MNAQHHIQTEHVARSFSNAAAQYDEEAQLQHRVMRNAAIYAEKYFDADAMVLDAGCGTGSFARYTKARHPAWQMHGLDLAKGMCALAAPHYIDMQPLPMEEMPYANEHFQGVFSSLALQWVDDVGQAFREMARVLEPGGVAVCASFTQGTLKELRAASEIAQLAPTVLDMHTQAEYKAWARDADLSVLEMRGRREMHWMPDVRALLKHLRVLGATNQLKERAHHVTSPKRFRAMVDAYQYHFGSGQGIPVTWETVMLVLRKPHI